MFAVVHTISLLIALLVLNELFRRYKWFTVAFFVVLPIILTATVWIETGSQEGSSINTWFHWAKLYSVIAAAIGFTIMRYTKAGANKYVKFFPALILAINIAEAVGRDFELGLATGGIWHYLNGTAGILSIITICGWAGIYIEKKDKSDMLWPDMTVSWIIAYDIWNFVYIYFCVPEHAAYGFAVLSACTIPSLFIKRGTWIQARSFTLAVWMMYLFTFPVFIDSPTSRIDLPDNPTLFIVLGAVSLAANAAFAIVHFTKMFRQRAFGFGQEVHTAS